MTSTATEKIKNINKIKREIIINDKKILNTRNNIDYDKLIEISYNLHNDLKNKIEELLSSINTTIELQSY